MPALEFADSPTPTRVDWTVMGDGVLFRLTGSLTAAVAPQLREALLQPFEAECRDLIVDAGGVETVDVTAVAILLAAREAARHSGRRFLLSRSSAALDAALDTAGANGALPRLGPPRKRPVVPAQRLALVS